MRATNALLVALSAAAVQCHNFPRQTRNATEAPSDATPRRYIIELSSREESARAASRAADIPGLRIVNHFDSDIFPGISVECDGACDAESLKAAFHDDASNADGSTSTVAHVYKSQRIKLAPAVEEEIPSVDALAAGQNNTIHQWTGVQKLHEAGILGKGAVVAVVDSGIQYSHPGLGGGIGPNYTVIGGYDLVGSKWPDTPPTPDDDPTDEYGHGTHVAGIIAGNNEHIIGVAPSSKLLAFKVFGDSGYSEEEIVIQGFLKAYESGADIISASLGENSGFTNNAWAVVASRIVDNGVIVVIAAGNAGQDGPWLASNGASGKHVLTVGSVDPSAFPAQTFSVVYNQDGGSNSTEVTYVPGNSAFPDTVVDFPVVPLTLNTSVENDACEPLPSDTPSFKESIVLVKFGGCTVDTKHANVAAFGAQYVLFYNTDNSTQSAASLNATGLTAAVDATVSKAIINAVLEGGNVTASFDIQTTHYTGAHSAAGGKPALYTSWGGTFDLALKPDISAPGSKILSTYPTDDYRVLSGTSMATPYIAGIAALYVGKFGGRAAHANDPDWAKRVIARITSSGRSVPWADWVPTAKDYGFWAPAPQVGAGLVDAASVLGYTTQLGFDGRKFELNDTANFVGTHSLDITNNGGEAVTYKFSVQDAGGFDSWTPREPGSDPSFGVPGILYYSRLNPVEMTPEVSLPDEITIEPGETATTEFTFAVPSGLNTTHIPVYSGKILVTGSNDEKLGVPYFGVGCSIHDELTDVFDYGIEMPKLLLGGTTPIGDAPVTTTFNLSLYSQDFPHLNSQVVWGTEEIRWDVFDANWTEADWSYPPVIGENGFVGSATSWNGTDDSTYFDPEKHSEDDIFSFPVYYKVRGVWDRYWWLGRFANGSQVESGVYNFRIAALRPFGNRELSEDWDVFSVPQITVDLAE